MKMLRDSMHDLWLDVLSLLLKNKYKHSLEEGISEQQLSDVGREAWDILRFCSPKQDLPDKSGTAFYIGWGRCNVTHDDIAVILNEHLTREGRLKKPLTSGNIKRYFNSVRGKIRECAVSMIENDIEKKEKHAQKSKTNSRISGEVF